MAYSGTLDSNIMKTYQPSPNLEPNRKIKSNNFDWNINHPKSLSYLCVIVISNNWPETPITNFPLRKDNDLFFQMLDTNISVQLLTDKIKDDIFWKRAYTERWKSYKLPKEKTWIQAYMEKHFAEVLENMHPKSYDPEKVMRLVSLCSPFIRNLSIKSLVPVDPLNLDGDTSPEMAKYLPVGDNIKRKPLIVKEFMRDHIPLQAALGNLPHLVELHLTFQLRNLGAAFRRDAFQCTNADAKSLAKGLEKCTQLRTLRITRSDVNCSQVKYILRALSDHTRLYCLDFSHCSIAEEGALYIAKYISKKENVKSLILVNNKFSVQGAEGLSYALNHSGCGLRILDLRLNTRMGSDGVAHLAVALARGCNLHSINLSGCGIQPGPLRNPPSDVWFATTMEHAPSCGELLARAIGLGRTPLRSLDISVNNLGIDVGDALANSICLSLLVDVRLRRCGIGSSAAAIGESAAAAQKLRREAEKGVKFRRSAGRVLQARRVAKGMNIDTDLVLLAQQLSARPSIVSVTSEEGTYNVQALPLPTDFGFVPSFKDPLPSSRASSLTGPISSRRSSHHQVLEPVKETRRSALVRRGSDGSLLHAKSAETQRRIKIFVCNNNNHSEA